MNNQTRKRQRSNSNGESNNNNSSLFEIGQGSMDRICDVNGNNNRAVDELKLKMATLEVWKK
jgi:hypothetical protein